MKRTLIVLFLLLSSVFAHGCAQKTGLLPETTAPPALDTPEVVTAIVAKNGQGFPIALRSITKQEGHIRAEFCFRNPTTDDWQLGTSANDVLLTRGDLFSVRDQGGLIVPNQNEGEERCLYALFPAPDWKDSTNGTITIQKIETSRPEVPDCKKAQEKLNRKLIPIRFECRVGDHSSGYDIIEKPVTMTMEKARELVYFEGIVDVIRGPWIFEVKLVYPSMDNEQLR